MKLWQVLTLIETSAKKLNRPKITHKIEWMSLKWEEIT